jgi:glycosyltransferase involved in cell wall biosynthesis
MKKRYRIAIIAGQLVVGGAERQLFLWLSHLDREIFQPVVLTLHPDCGDYWEPYIESLGIPLIRIKHRRNRLVRLIDIVKSLRPYKPQLIHGWHLFASPYAGLAAKLLGAKSLGGVRSSFRAFKDLTYESRITLRFVDAILTNSATVSDQITPLLKQKNQSIYTVQNAVEDQSDDRLIIRQKLSKLFDISPSGIWIGTIGRMDPGKHIDIFLRVVEKLCKEFNDFHCLIIGDGSERASLERITDELSIRQYVTFTGEIPGASAWLSAFDIFCFTSLSEGLPNAVMEAAAAGIPIVSWRISFIQELLEDRQTAILVEPEDLAGMKGALIELMVSPNLRKKMGKTAQSHILSKFSLDCYIRQMTHVYDTILSTVSIPSRPEK